MINQRSIEEVVIDPHFEERHSESVNDDIILSVVQALDGRVLEPESVSSTGYHYYVTECPWGCGPTV